MISKARFAGTVLMMTGLAGLTACGGSGSSSSGDTASPLVVLSAETTPETVQVVVAELSASLMDDVYVPMGMDAAPADSSATDSTKQTLKTITALVRDKRPDATVQAAAIAEDDAVVMPQASETYYCDMGGKVTYSWTNTSEKLVFDNCMESWSWDRLVYMHGEVSLNNIKEAYEYCIDTFSATFSFKNFVSRVENYEGIILETSRINGAVDVSEKLDYCDVPDEWRLTGSALNVTFNAESVGYYNFDMRDWDYWDYWESSMTVKLDLSRLDGSVQITTPQNVKADGSSDYPYEGQVKLVMANNASVLMTILNSTQVLIEADFNGNGTYDCTENVLWTDLANATWSCDGLAVID